jgi:hypothetical protein
MNERIKELAEQAWNDTREKFGSFVDDGGEIDYTFLHAYDQKFAELIVRECAELTLDYKNDQHYQGWLDYRNEIKKHFGVEE